MSKLSIFNNVSLDGYFVDGNGDMSWAHETPNDGEFNAFVEGNAQGGGRLVFGRITYEMMAGYWPTPQAAEMNPAVAQQMNALPKIVFSRTLTKASWNNTRLVKGERETKSKAKLAVQSAKHQGVLAERGRSERLKASHDYEVVGAKFDSDTVATMRFCDDCRSIRQKTQGEKYLRISENLR